MLSFGRELPPDHCLRNFVPIYATTPSISKWETELMPYGIDTVPLQDVCRIVPVSKKP